MRKSIVFYLIITAIFLNFNTVQAGESPESTLSLFPPVFEHTASPGEKIKDSFEIVNKGDFSIRLKSILKNFKVVDEKGKIEFTDEDTGFSMNQWILPEFLEFTLKGKETKEINFIISIPEDEKCGAHYGAILFEPVKAEQRLKNEFAFLILLNIEEGDELKNKANIAEFKAPFLNNQSPIKFTLRLENTGDVHLKPEGELAVYNLFGSQVGRAVLKNKIVYPSSTRELVSFWDRKYLSGIYKAKINLSYGNPSQTLEAETFFIVFPWRLIVFSGLAILILAYILKRYMRMSLRGVRRTTK